MRYFYDKANKRLLALDDLGQSIYSLFELDEPGVLNSAGVEKTTEEATVGIRPESPRNDAVLFPTKRNKAKPAKPRQAEGEQTSKQQAREEKYERVRNMLADGHSYDEIVEAEDISKPTISRIKSTMNEKGKTRIPARMHKKEEKTEELEKEWDPEPTEDDITQIWEIVDMGIRDYPDIAKRAGVPVSVVKKVLLKPRP